MICYRIHWLIHIKEKGGVMLHIWEGTPIVGETLKRGQGNSIWIEILKFLAVILSVNLIMVFVIEIIKKAFFRGSLIEEDIAMLIQLYGSIIGIGLVILYCYGIEKRKLACMGIIRSSFFQQYMKGILVGGFLISVIVLIGELLGIFVFDEINQNLNIKIILLFFFGFLLQGFYEELVFRGFLMISIIKKSTIFVAVMINSLLFGLTHGFNDGIHVLGLLNLILFGIFESIYLLKNDNIWGVSAIHSMWNFMQGSIYGFNVSGMAQSQSLLTFKIKNCEIFSGGTFGLEGSLLTTIVLASGILIAALYKNRMHE